MIKISLLIVVLLFSRSASARLRPLTETEKKLLPARIVCGRDYDKTGAHFKFAGILYDLGLMESAFRNAESILRNNNSPESVKSFSALARRPLKEILTPEQRHRIALAPEAKQPELYRNVLQTAAVREPAAAAYLRFAAMEKLWNSDRESDIELLCRQIRQASRDPSLRNLRIFNKVCAEYLYLRAKDYEADRKSVV